MNDKDLWEREISTGWFSPQDDRPFVENRLKGYKESGKWYELGDYYFVIADYSNARYYYEKHSEKDDIRAWECRSKAAQCIYYQGKVTETIDHLLKLNDLTENSSSNRDSFYDKRYFTRVALKLAIKHNRKETALSIIKKYSKNLSIHDQFKVLLSLIDILNDDEYIKMLENFQELYQLDNMSYELIGSDRVEEGLLALKYYFIRWYHDNPNEYPGMPNEASTVEKIMRFIENGHSDQAVECCNLMIQEAEKNRNEKDLKKGLDILIYTYEKSDNFLEAAKTKIRLFSITNDDRLLWQAANDYKKVGDFENAAKLYGKMKDDWHHLRNSGICYEQCKLWKEAAEMYNKAADKCKNAGAGNNALARELYQKAAEMYEKISKGEKAPGDKQQFHQSPKKIKNSICPSCGEEIKLHFKMCPVCGIELRKNKCVCGEELKSHWKNCPNCGRKI